MFVYLNFRVCIVDIILYILLKDAQLSAELLLKTLQITLLRLGVLSKLGRELPHYIGCEAFFAISLQKQVPNDIQVIADVRHVSDYLLD